MIKEIFICDVCEKETTPNDLHRVIIEDAIATVTNGGFVQTLHMCEKCLEERIGEAGKKKMH
jgi:hypothetical protein